MVDNRRAGFSRPFARPSPNEPHFFRIIVGHRHGRHYALPPWIARPEKFSRSRPATLARASLLHIPISSTVPWFFPRELGPFSSKLPRAACRGTTILEKFFSSAPGPS